MTVPPPEGGGLAEPRVAVLVALATLAACEGAAFTTTSRMETDCAGAADAGSRNLRIQARQLASTPFSTLAPMIACMSSSCSGFMIALVPPTLMAVVEYGFTRGLIVVIAYTVINFIVDNVIKPRFVGSTLDLSPLIVVVSLVFWGWLLGPMGALVAVPLSIGVKFFFESFEESMWLAHLMSDAGPKPVVLDVEGPGDSK